MSGTNTNVARQVARSKYQPGPSFYNSLFGKPGSTPQTRLAAGLMVGGLAAGTASGDLETTEDPTPDESANGKSNPSRTTPLNPTSLLSTLAKDASVGAVLATLIKGRYLKYTAIWIGLFALALVLVVKGLGVSTPSPTKIVPVPE